MPRKAKPLSALEVSRLTKPGHHAVGTVDGLYLYVTATGGRSWVLRVMIGTQRRHLGLGSFPEVSLAAARDAARSAREQIRLGVDPIEQRLAQRSALKVQQANAKTFEEAARSYVDSHEDAWKNPKHRSQWISTLETYVFPVMGTLLVRDVDQEHVLRALEPIWKTKTETASRVRGRIESVLDWAAVRKLRADDNPARWKGRLDKLLPAPKKIQKVAHHRALPFAQLPGFMNALRHKEGMAARALEFAILTAARSGEVREATWQEIDLQSRIWTVPAARMKAGREHRVPLTPQVFALISTLPRTESTELVFPSARQGPLSDMSLTAVLRRMEVNAVPHGFRSTFRDWVSEVTNHPRDLAEQALAHTLTNKVEAAYRRGDALEKRRLLMQDWADYCYSMNAAKEELSSAFELLKRADRKRMWE